jgi:hypothetical protein
MTPCDEDTTSTSTAAIRPQATAAHFGVALLLLHTSMTLALWKAGSFVVWDASTPLSDAAFGFKNALAPLVWPIMGCATALVIFHVAVDAIRSCAMPRLRPADLAAMLLLMVPAILAWAMTHATPTNPQIRIAANPLIYLPALPAYVLLASNSLSRLSSATWERIIVALIGLPSLMMLVRSAIGFGGWLMNL